jgi:hypothetical protein
MPKVQGLHSAEAQMQAQSRRARRLYLGQLPFQAGITEDMLTREINAAMRARNLCEQSEGDPVIHMWFARDKGGNYGFVEFRSQTECERALLLDGLQCGGASIQIRRPSDFPMSQMPDILPAPGMPSPAPAIPGMPGMAGFGMNMPGGMNPMMAGMRALPTLHTQFGMKGNGTGAPTQLMAPIPEVDSAIVLIKQVFTVDDETDADDFKEVCEDMKQGCSAHGTLMTAFIVTPQLQAQIPESNVADVFMQFQDNKMAGMCIGKMTGRKYDGKPITIETYAEAQWAQFVKPHL